MPTSEGTNENRSFFGRYALVIVLLLVPPVPWILIGANRAVQNPSNDPRQWLPRGFEETEIYDWFQNHFGIDEMAVVSRPGCTLNDERIDVLTDSVKGGRSVLGVASQTM